MIKHLRLLLTLLIVYSPALYAQVGFGPEIGLNVSNMLIVPPGSFSVSNSSLAGLRIGGLADINLNGHLYAQAGAYFSMKGNKRTFNYKSSDTLSEKIDETLKVNYIEIPGSIIYKTGSQGSGRFFCGLGIAFAFATGGSDQIDDYVTLNGQTQVAHSKASVSPGNTVNNFDIALNVTAGYELHSGLFIRTFYTMGVNNISTIDGESDKNRVFGISAGYLFGKRPHKKIATEDIMFE